MLATQPKRRGPRKQKRKRPVYSPLEQRVDEALFGNAPVRESVRMLVIKAEQRGAERMQRYCARSAREKYTGTGWHHFFRMAVESVARRIERLNYWNMPDDW